MAGNQVEAIKAADGDHKKQTEAYGKYVASMVKQGQAPKSINEIMGR